MRHKKARLKTSVQDRGVSHDCYVYHSVHLEHDLYVGIQNVKIKSYPKKLFRIA